MANRINIIHNRKYVLWNAVSVPLLLQLHFTQDCLPRTGHELRKEVGRGRGGGQEGRGRGNGRGGDERGRKGRGEEGESYTFFTARRSLHSLSYRNSVRLSVCLSLHPSVKLVDCVHMVRPTIMISSPYGSPIILVSGDITFIPKFEGGHPE